MQKQSIVLLTILFIVLVVFGLDYFVSVKAKQDYLDLRNTRLLVRLANQITSQVHAVQTVADNQIDPRDSSFSGSLITNLNDLIPGVRWIQAGEPVSGEYRPAYAYPSFIAPQDSIQLLVHYLRTVDGRKTLHLVFDIGGLDVMIAQLRNTDRIFHEIAFVRLSDGVVIESSEGAHGLLRFDSIPGVNGITIMRSQMGNGDQVGLMTVAGEEHRLYVHPLNAAGGLPTGPESESWAICGLVESKDFHDTSLAISFISLVMLALIAVLIFLCWPLLKLKLTDRGDSIRLSEVIGIGLSVVFGACVITFLTACVLLKLASTDRLDSQLRSLGTETAARFVTEVDSLSQTLESLTQEYAGLWSPRGGRGGMSFSLFDAQTGRTRLRAPAKLESTLYPFFDQFYAVNSHGDQLYKARIDTIQTRCGNVRERDYFTSVTGRRLLSVRGKRLAIQPLVSKSTGEFSVTLAEPGEREGGSFVKGIDFRPVSVMNPILPPGFEFCIFDARGAVLFHSKSERNLQENFLEETSDPELIRSAMNARTDVCFSTTYWGEESRVYVRPVESLPWFIAAMYPIQNTYIIGLQTVSIALLFFVLYILPFFLVFLIALLSPVKRATWIWPDREKREWYIIISAFAALVSMTLLAVFLFGSDSDSAWTLAVVLPHMCLVLLYLQFSPLTTGRLRRGMILAVDAFLLVLFSRITPLQSSVSTLSVTAVAFCALAFCSLVLPAYEKKRGFRRKPESGEAGWFDFRKAYVTTVFLFLITGIVLPSAIFFKIAFEEQVTLYMRENQLEIVHRLENRQARLREEFRSRPSQYRVWFRDRRMAKFADIYTGFFNATRIETRPYRQRAQRWIDSAFVRPFMPAYDKMSIDLRTVAADPADSSYAWYSEQDSVILGRARPLAASLDPARGALWLVSAVPVIADISSPWNLYQWLFIVAVIIGLAVGLYLIIGFIAREVFLVEIGLFSQGPGVVDENVFASRWRGLSESKKIVLRRLASDGFVNSRYLDTVTALIQEGLVLRAPEIRVPSPRIARYILIETKESKEAPAEPAARGKQSTKILQIAIYAFLLVFVLFLFWTQRQLWTTTLTFISAASVALPLVFKMLGGLDSKNRQSE
jgi:hypothetical protein